MISGNWFGTTIDKSKYTVGGYKAGEKVTLKKGIKWYNTGKKMDSSLAGAEVSISSVKTTYTGKSNQVLTVVRNGVVLGIVRAQDVSGAYNKKKSTQYYYVKRNTNYYKNKNYKNRVKALKAGSVIKGKAVKVGSHYEIKTSSGYVSANKNVTREL